MYASGNFLKLENSVRHHLATTAIALALALGGAAACSGGGGGSSASPPSPSSPPPASPPPPPPPTPSEVTISGRVTFQRVPHNLNAIGLNYDAESARPARGVVVEAVDASNNLLTSDVTDSDGDYAVTVDPNTSVRIRVRAQMQQTAGASWDVSVLDNTSGNAPYFLLGSLTSSGTLNSVRNLNAPSGWNTVSNSYTNPRAAGPFAILDSLYKGFTGVQAVDPDISFPDLEVYWSVNNTPSDGDIANGDVGTSFYTRFNDVSTIVILGAANNDTDEYDEHVIVHEYGHFLEDRLSRSDSIGGPHSLTDRLDPRVAFGEGFGNAVSSILLSDSIYRDAAGANQGSGFAFSNESTSFSPTGWYNESSIGLILFDIADSISDGADQISAGFAPIYDVLTSNAYRTSPEATTIFLFIDELRSQTSISDAAITALVSAQNINGTGPQGAGETNSGGISNALPVFKSVTVGGPALNICSDDEAGEENKLGNRNLIRFTVASQANLTLTMTRTSGAATSNPDFHLFRNGSLIALATSGANNTETLNRTLSSGEYLVDAFDLNVVEGSGADVCFNFSVN